MILCMPWTIQASALVFVIAGLVMPQLGPAEEIFEDDFSQPLGKRWQSVGGDWVVKQKRLIQSGASGDHCRLIANFPVREAIVEVEASPVRLNALNFSSVGLVGKYVDDDRQWWFRYGSYGLILLDGRGKGIEQIHLGSVRPELGKTYRLKLIMRHGLVGVCVNGAMIAIVQDPFGKLAGRPGIFTESPAEFAGFKVRRFAPAERDKRSTDEGEKK